MEPKLTGVLAMKKGDAVGAFRDNEMYAFARANDTVAERILETHMFVNGLEPVGEFLADGDEVFEKTVAVKIGERVVGSVFQVGHSATDKNVEPVRIDTLHSEEPSSWR